jgi:hypothetical protein
MDIFSAMTGSDYWITIIALRGGELSEINGCRDGQISHCGKSVSQLAKSVG